MKLTTNRPCRAWLRTIRGRPWVQPLAGAPKSAHAHAKESSDPTIIKCISSTTRERTCSKEWSSTRHLPPGWMSLITLSWINQARNLAHLRKVAKLLPLNLIQISENVTIENNRWKSSTQTGFKRSKELMASLNSWARSTKLRFMLSVQCERN